MAAKAGAKAPKPKNTPPPTPPHAPPAEGADQNNGHPQNQGPLTVDDRAHLLIVHLANHRASDDKLEEAMNVVRGIKKQRNRLRGEIRSDGFKLTLVDEILEDEKAPRHEVEDREVLRDYMRGVVRLPGGGNMEQIDLFDDSFTRKDQTADKWIGHGYTTGLRGLEQDPAKYEVPPDHHQAWLESWHEGQKKLAEAWTRKQEIDGTEPPPQFRKPVVAEEETAAAGAGTDGVTLGDGEDSLAGTEGDDTVRGEDSADEVTASDGDTVQGGEGADEVVEPTPEPQGDDDGAEAEAPTEEVEPA